MKHAVTTFAAVLLVAVVASGVGACATATIHSRVWEQAQEHVYGKLMVFISLQNIGLQQDAERRAQRALRDLGTDAVRSVDVLVPGRAYSVGEVSEAAHATGIDGVLVVTSSSAGTKQVLIPAKTLGPADTFISDSPAPLLPTNTTFGGSVVSLPWAQFEAALRDVPTGKLVWSATVSSSVTLWSVGMTSSESWPRRCRNSSTKTALSSERNWATA